MLKRFRGSIMLLLAAIIWGTAFVAQSKGMDYVEPFTYNSIRTLIGGIALFPVNAVLSKRSSLHSVTHRKVSIIGGICCGIILFAASSFQQLGISMTTAGKAGFITALYVIIVPVSGLFFGKRPHIKIWVCAAVAVAGFYLLCVKKHFTISDGDIYVLISAFFYAFHIIAIDHFNARKADCMLMSCIQFFTAGTIMAICMFIFEAPSLENVLEARYTILYTGIMSCAVAYTLQIAGQKYTEPSVATLIMSLESVFAALSGWLILHEKLSIREIIGCIFVFSAVIAAQYERKNKEKDLFSH